MSTIAFERPRPLRSTRRPGVAADRAVTSTGDAAWVRPCLIGLLAATAALYLWGLGASGWANPFYSAAVQAGTHSWKAFFFGSSDAANFITIDKPPAALWVMELSARIFGVNAWSILVPEALEGVAAVGLLYVTVRRWSTPAAGLLAGAVLATTPVAALMFRFNNPDALLVLLLVAAAYATVRAVDSGRTLWLVAAMSLVGAGFLTKMLQALLVVPAIGLVYLLAGPPKLGRRIAQLAVAGVALVVSSLWWVVAVQLVPAASRPYIGGSQNNSLWNLIFGYNGFGRLTGNEAGSVGGGGQTGSRWGATGLTRLFNSEMGGQISWLLPAALVLLVAGVVMAGRARRTDRARAALVLWGGWLLVTGVVFSLGQGIIHPYYTVALAPAVGALVGIGAVSLWSRRSNPVARAVLAAVVVVTAVWARFLLARTPTWNPWLGPVVVGAGVFAAVLLLIGLHAGRPVRAMVAALAIVAALAGPTAFAVSTAATAHSGAIPSAGPATAGGFGGGGAPGRTFGGGGARPAGGGGVGGLLNGSTPTTALTTLLETDSGSYTWVAATVQSNQAAGYQLATGSPVMAIGGFNGTDPAPSVARFEALVSQGRIHYFIAGSDGGGGGFGGSQTTTTSVSGQITTWVEGHFTSTTVGGVTVYDLTSPA